MTQTYHNTTHETGRALRLAIEAARTQEDKVLAYFRTFPPGHQASASRVHQAVFGFGWETTISGSGQRREHGRRKQLHP